MSIFRKQSISMKQARQFWSIFLDWNRGLQRLEDRLFDFDIISYMLKRNKDWLRSETLSRYFFLKFLRENVSYRLFSGLRLTNVSCSRARVLD